MSLLTYVPRKPLADFVELLWLYRRVLPSHPKERLLPQATMELVIDLRDDTCGPLVVGPHSKPCEIDTAEPAVIAGVHFKPGGAFAFLRGPVSELHNERVQLDALWGKRAYELHERLLEAKTPAARFCVLEQSLLKQLARPEARHPAVAFAIEEFHHGRPVRTVADVTNRIGLSSRRFIEAFTEEVGVTPKLFCRIVRFQEALDLIDMDGEPDWTGLALACGYYDQSHFIHDFHEFSGLNPTTYLQVRSEHRNHVPLYD